MGLSEFTTDKDKPALKRTVYQKPPVVEPLVPQGKPSLLSQGSQDILKSGKGPSANPFVEPASSFTNTATPQSGGSRATAGRAASTNKNAAQGLMDAGRRVTPGSNPITAETNASMATPAQTMTGGESPFNFKSLQQVVPDPGYFLRGGGLVKAGVNAASAAAKAMGSSMGGADDVSTWRTFGADTINSVGELATMGKLPNAADRFFPALRGDGGATAQTPTAGGTGQMPKGGNPIPATGGNPISGPTAAPSVSVPTRWEPPKGMRLAGKLGTPEQQQFADRLAAGEHRLGLDAVPAGVLDYGTAGDEGNRMSYIKTQDQALADLEREKVRNQIAQAGLEREAMNQDASVDRARKSESIKSMREMGEVMRGGPSKARALLLAGIGGGHDPFGSDGAGNLDSLKKFTEIQKIQADIKAGRKPTSGKMSIGSDLGDKVEVPYTMDEQGGINYDVNTLYSLAKRSSPEISIDDIQVTAQETGMTTQQVLLALIGKTSKLSDEDKS